VKLEVKGLNTAVHIIAYCSKHIALLGSKSAAKKAILKGRLRLNGKKAALSSQIKNGDILELQLDKPKTKPGISIHLPIVFEDDYMIIVNKPGGIAVNGNRNKTVENIVGKISRKSSQVDALPSPIAAHRLDVPTKGLVVFAKTKTALIQLNKSFQLGKIEKEYSAVVHGKTTKQGRINLPIQGKSATTEFTLVRTVPSKLYQHISLLQLKLLTGRTHQLRIHLQSIGHLIVGDKQYAGDQKTILGKGLFLCASKIAFVHPISGKPVQLEIELPLRFKRLLDREETRFQGESRK